MAEKKYYWLKLKRDFFKRHDIQIIEAMPNGKEYVLFYLKVLVEAIDHEGMLRFSDTIPYNAEMLATITNTNIDIVRSAMNVFKSLELVEILSDETIYLKEIERLTGCETQWAERKRKERLSKGQLLDIVQQMSNECPTNVLQEKEIEKDKEIEIDKELEIDILIALPLNDKSEFPVSKKDVDEWQEAFPSVDILAELRKMKSWLNDNPTRRKTKSGIRRFVNLWLSREQDKPKTQTSSNPFLEMLKEMEDEQN